MALLVWLVGTLFAGGWAYVLFYMGHRGKHFPPGPPTLPIIGNIHQMPRKTAHLQFTRWAEKYGGLYVLKLGTGTMAVITDRQLVKDLIDKKSTIYSSRPNLYIIEQITGGDHILMMDYISKWRESRKLLHGSFMERVVEDDHLPLVEAEARQMLRDYLLIPEEHMLHPKRYSNSIIMSLVWGIRTPSTQTEHMKRLYDVMDILSKVVEAGASPPVDIYPIFHYLPQSLFSNWRDRVSYAKRELIGLYSSLLSDLRDRRAASGSKYSFMDKVLDQVDAGKHQEGLTYTDHELAFLGGSVIEGGSDTASSVIIAFVQAMITWPKIQAKAQAEIDAVVGPDRSPTWADYAQLPYVAQCVKEAMRWRPVVPIPFPHMLAQDDWVQGKFLPKGTIIMINAWGMQHDAQRFPDPDTFDPDHFAGVTKLANELAAGPADERDHYAYGAGRRICPGIHLAERKMFVAMAKILWAFDIRPGQDIKNDSEKTVTMMPDINPETGYTEGALVCAKDFPAEFHLRGSGGEKQRQRRATILREFDEARKNVFCKYAE